MAWDWLTSATGPWWSAPAASVVSFIAGQWIATRSATDQRNSDNEQRDKEREAAAKEAERARNARAREEQQRREAESRALEQERIDALFDDALDSIHTLQAEMTKFRKDDDVAPDAIRNFARSMNKLRAYERAIRSPWLGQLDPEAIVNKTTDLVLNGPGETFEGVLEVVADLTRMAVDVREVFGDRLEARTLTEGPKPTATE